MMVLSSGIVIVRQEQAQWKFLFLRAYQNWDFPKGIVEAQEKPLETAIREAREETGISDLDFRWGRVYKETQPYNRGTKVARYYIAQTPESEVVFSINPEIGKPEHHEYRWLTYDQLIRLSPPRLLPIIQWAHRVIQGL